MDVSLQWVEKRSEVRIQFPARLSRALHDAGFNRCEVVVVEDGILLRPYVAAPEEVVLPEKWSR